MSRPADRMRRLRARRAQGRVCLPVEIDDVAVPEMLVDAGFLPASLVDDRAAVAKALSRFIASAIAVDIDK